MDKNVAIIGAGMMGRGISIELARKGYNVTLLSLSANKTDPKHTKSVIQTHLDRIKMDNIEKELVFTNLVISNDEKKLSNQKLVIECLIEDLNSKREILKLGKPYINENTIVASNTSSLLVNEIFENIFDLSKVIGIHFFNPVNVMKLVELSLNGKNHKDDILYVENILNDLNKEVIKVDQTRGYIVNKLLIPMINEASKILDNTNNVAEKIDNAMMFGANHPIGPLKLADLIGLDVVYKILLELKKDDKSLLISEGLIKLVEDKKLGRKTKIGFYDYSIKK